MRFPLLVSLFLLSALAVAAAPSRADELPDAATLRERIAQAAGPEPANVREVITGAGVLGDTRTVTYRTAGDSRTVLDWGPMHTERGVFRGEAWHQSPNGLTVIDQPDPPNVDQEPTTTSVVRAPAPLDGYVLSTLNARGYGTRDFVDAATYQVVKHQSLTAFGTTTTTFSDFQAYGSRTMAAHWTVISETQLEENYALSEYAAGAASPGDVAVPPTRRLLVEFPAGTSRADLPVTLDRGEIYVTVMIGKSRFEFLLDTGAPEIVVDPGVARSVGLAVFDQIGSTRPGHITIGRTVIPAMTVGPLAMHDVAVEVAPMPRVGHSLSGLLGFDFLAQLGVTIDYENRRVTAVPAAAFVPPAETHMSAFDVRLGTGQPMTTVQIDGATGDRFLLDTGASGSLVVFDYFGRQHPQPFHTKVGEAAITGLGGATPVTVYQFNDVAMANIHFKGYEGWRVASVRSYAYNVDGVIGSTFLSLFKVALDYTGGRVYLTPNGTSRRIMRLQ